MGQQQLLLLVLGVVIVGLAVVVGINAFSENQKQANADAMVTDALRIASDIQAYAAKPDQFGGGGGWGDGSSGVSANAPDFNDDLGYNENTDGDYENANGVFTITSSSSDCTNNPTGQLYVNGTNTELNNTVCVGISGLSADDIDTEIDYGS